MPVRIAICDDREDDTLGLCEALRAYDPSFTIRTYTNAGRLLDDIEEPFGQFDLFFLDIRLPEQNGIETAAELRNRKSDGKIVFTALDGAFYPQSYELFAYNYLIKPVTQDKLNPILDRAMMDTERERRQQISFRCKGTTYRVYCRDITHLESRDKTISFHMADRSVLQCQAKMDDMEAQLPKDIFIRCHQSYLVNAHHVNEMSGCHFHIVPDIIGISKKYQKAAKQSYFHYLFTHRDSGR